MAHLLTLTYDNQVVTLTSGAYALVDFTPEIAAIEAESVTETMVVRVAGDTPADLSENLQVIERVLMLAKRNLSRGSGEKVWLNFTPSGYVGAYQSEVLDGRVDLPRGVLKADWANQEIEVTLTLTRRNYWQAVQETKLDISNDVAVTETEIQPAGAVNKEWQCCAMSADGEVLIAGVLGGRLYLSVDGGDNWSEIRPAGDVNKLWQCCAMSADGEVLIAGVLGGRMYLSVDGGDNWSEIRPAGDADKDWVCCEMSADGEVLITAVYDGRLYLSIDGGDNWAETKPAGAVDKVWTSCAVSADGVVFTAGSNVRLYMSIDGGDNWSEIRPAGDENKLWQCCAISADGAVLIAGAYSGRMYLSVDGGDNWSEIRPAGDENKLWKCCGVSANGAVLIAGVYDDRLYLSIDGGVNWAETKPAGDDDNEWQCCAVNANGTSVMAGMGNIAFGMGLLYISDAPAREISLANAGTTACNWLQFSAQTGFDLPAPLEYHLWGDEAFAARLYAGVFDFDVITDGFTQLYDVGSWTSSTGSQEEDVTCFGGYKMEFELADDTVESASVAFQSTMEKYLMVAGMRLRPILRWADTDDIANVQVRLRLVSGSTSVWTTNWVTPDTYKIQELPILVVPAVASVVGKAYDPQFTLAIDVRRITSDTETVAIDFIELFPSINMTVLDHGIAGVTGDDDTYHLLDLPYDADAPSILYDESGADYHGCWTRLGKLPLMITPDEPGALVFAWRDNDGTAGDIAEKFYIRKVSYHKRRLSL